ncbi:MAG TPA: hypothetical protein VF613_02685 [Longimicrobium sp.]|jgi:hypothetical protein
MKKSFSADNTVVAADPQETPPTPKLSSVRPKQIKRTAGGGVRRWGGEPTKADMIERIDQSPEFFASLTDEQWDAIESYDGPEALGGSDAPHGDER